MGIKYGIGDKVRVHANERSLTPSDWTKPDWVGEVQAYTVNWNGDVTYDVESKSGEEARIAEERLEQYRYPYKLQVGENVRVLPELFNMNAREWTKPEWMGVVVAVKKQPDSEAPEYDIKSETGTVTPGINPSRLERVGQQPKRWGLF